MEFDTDLVACAQLVERGDPDRFRAVMAAPVPARAVLFPIYAFNVEIARAPWVTAEPLIAEMRLQWWADALEEIRAGGVVRRHEVVTPLAHALDAEGATILATCVEARRADTASVSASTWAALSDYLRDTGGPLLWAAARALGSTEEDRSRTVGEALARANYLLAAPELARRGKQPWPEEDAAALGEWAKEGLALLSGPSAKGRPSQPQRQAELCAWRARGLLSRAAKAPEAALRGEIEESAARARLSLGLRAAGVGRSV